MTALTPLTVTPRGIGPGPTAITDAIITAPASRTGILWVRNRGSNALTVSVTIPDNDPESLGDRTMSENVPPSAQRFFALTPRLADTVTGIITYTLGGDTSNVDSFVLERLERQ